MESGEAPNNSRMSSNPARNFRAEMGLGVGLASERAANDLSVALVAYVHKLQHDLCEARRREGLLVERIEVFEERLGALEKGGQESDSGRMDRFECRLSRLERTVDGLTKRQEHDDVCDGAQMNATTPVSKQRDMMPNVMEMVTPARIGFASNLQAQQAALQCCSPEVMRCGQEMGPSQSDEFETLPVQHCATGRKTSNDDRRMFPRDAAKRIETVGRSVTKTKTAGIKKVGKDVRKAMDGDSKGRVEVKQEECVHVDEPEGAKMANGGTRGVKRPVMTAKKDKLKRAKRSSSRRVSSSSEVSKPIVRAGPDASGFQAISGGALASGLHSTENVGKLGMKAEAQVEQVRGDEAGTAGGRKDGEYERDRVCEFAGSAMVEKGAVAEEEVDLDAGGRHSCQQMVQDGLRTAGDAIRLVHERERRREREQYDVLNIAEQRRNNGDIVVHCAECTQKFKDVAANHDLNDAGRVDDWLRKYCRHQRDLKSKRETPDGYWDLSFDDTPTQPPAL